MEQEESVEELKKKIIHLMTEEINFLKGSAMTLEELKRYRYSVCGDGSEFRRF
jgi:hypothetical protein